MKNKRIIQFFIIVFIVSAIIVQAKQRRLEAIIVDNNHFCLYMDSFRSNQLGLIGCFKGTMHDVNSGDDKLTNKMERDHQILNGASMCLASN